MNRLYGVIVRKSEEGFWAEAPDLSGCYGQGESFMEALSSMSDSMETHLAALVEYGIDIPSASKITSPDGEVVYMCIDDGATKLGEPVVTAAEAARRLEVTPGRVSQLIAAGRLAAQRTASSTLVTVSSINEYASSARKAGRPKKAALA